MYVSTLYIYSEVNIGLHHIFSAELDETKRNYILQAYEDVEHVFGDVICFQNQRGYCYRCEEEHEIDGRFAIDLGLCGPSCKDLSGLS